DEPRADARPGADAARDLRLRGGDGAAAAEPGQPARRHRQRHGGGDPGGVMPPARNRSFDSEALPMSIEDTNPRAPAKGSAILTWLACLVALAASAGSVYLSMGMGLKACPLCFYQRTLVMGVFGVLLVGLVTGAPRSGLCLLALPLAAAALGVAGYHVYLELT